MNFIYLGIKKIISRTIDYILQRLHLYYCDNYYFDKKVSINLEEVESFLISNGVKEGATLLVHSSWDKINSGKFSTVELIKKLQSIIGPSGTLLMPCFPPVSFQKSDILFLKDRFPSAAGLLTETFRRYPKVQRSINLIHSVISLGPNTEYLISDHHSGITPFDECSPYYRISKIPNSFIVGLGVGHNLKVCTSLHCVESILRTKFKYYKKIFNSKITYRYISENGVQLKHTLFKRSGKIFTPNISKFFSKTELKESTIGNVDLYIINANTLINKTIELGRKGINMYIWPLQLPWEF